MSGGHFDYKQNYINQIAEDIDDLIKNNEDTSLDKYGCMRGYHFSEEIIEKFKEAKITLEIAANMARRIDWLVSGDDGPESFIERWKEDVESLQKK
jgi:hypothetical protein